MPVAPRSPLANSLHRLRPAIFHTSVFLLAVAIGWALGAFLVFVGKLIELQ
jgi:hypothetical protein